jgi:hypothetical protein
LGVTASTDVILGFRVLQCAAWHVSTAACGCILQVGFLIEQAMSCESRAMWLWKQHLSVELQSVWCTGAPAASATGANCVPRLWLVHLHVLLFSDWRCATESMASQFAAHFQSISAAAALQLLLLCCHLL